MIQSTTETVIQVTDPQPARTKLVTFFIPSCLMSFQFVSRILALASTAIRGVCHLWAHYYPPLAFGVVMPHSALTFIINAFLAFAEIKSQGLPGFPFQTHPHTIMFSVTSLLMYGLCSTAELVVSAAGVDPTSVYAVIAHLGKIVSLCTSVASLASLFYI